MAKHPSAMYQDIAFDRPVSSNRKLVEVGRKRCGDSRRNKAMLVARWIAAIRHSSRVLFTFGTLGAKAFALTDELIVILIRIADQIEFGEDCVWP